MYEKETESYLTRVLKNFDQSCLYVDPNQQTELKEMFKEASKSGSGRGIPDRLYYDGHTLLVFECKSKNMIQAVNDLKYYKSKLIMNKKMDSYYIGVVKNAYEIYDNSFKIVKKTLSPNTFNLRINVEYDKSNMDRDIHNIHNYIRNHTKISNGDKGFFIACILISLKKSSFSYIMNKYDSKEYIYDLMKQNLIDYEIDVSVFEFLRNDENNIHFFNIIKMVQAIYIRAPTNDLLNHFYSEFVRYNNTDGKSLGIVLTPPHIVKLMIELLAINESDTFLDLCSGTGSFVLEALTCKPKQVIGVEYQTKLFNLLKCNMILRDVDIHTNTLIKGDCFDYEYETTKSAINPPYGMKDKRELDFVVKQLESTSEGGLVCAVIPCSKLNSNGANNILKRKIMDIGQVKTIINCNPKLFYPSACIQCCIIVIQKITPDKRLDNLFNRIDYTNDGLEVEIRNGKVKMVDFSDRYEKVLEEYKQPPCHSLVLETDWCYISNQKENLIDYKLNMTNTLLENLEREYLKQKQQIIQDNHVHVIRNVRSYKLSDLFEIKRGNVVMKNTKEGEYPLVTASGRNKGITKYTSSFSYENCISVANNGSIASSFYHEYKFDCTTDVSVLIPKTTLSKEVMIYICIELLNYKNTYNYGRKWNLTKMKNDTIFIPVIEDTIDIDCIQQIIDKYKVK